MISDWSWLRSPAYMFFFQDDLQIQMWLYQAILRSAAANKKRMPYIGVGRHNNACLLRCNLTLSERFTWKWKTVSRYAQSPSTVTWKNRRFALSKLAASSTRARGTTSRKWCHIHWWAHTLSSETKRKEVCKMSLRSCFFTQCARAANRSRSHRPFGRCPTLSCHPFHCYGIHIYRWVPTGRRKVQRNTT